jgi:YVTN family beta-propeller protein
MRCWVVAAGIFLPSLVGLDARAPVSEPHRSPIDVALVAGGHYVLTANHTADSVSLIDIGAGKVLAESPCGKRPVAVACSPDGKRAAVSNLWSSTISFLEIAEQRLQSAGEIAAPFPRGLVFAPDGSSFYAAVAGNDQIIQVDWQSRRIVNRWSAPREPRYLALSANGRWLAGASSRSAQVRCWDLRSGKLHWERTIEDAFNLRALVFTPDDQFVLCTHAIRRSFPVSRENIDKGWVIDSRITRLAVAKDALPNAWQVALDTRGQAVGDPHGLCFGEGGKLLVASAAGTHELLTFTSDALPWNAGDPGDFIDPGLHGSKHFRRVPVGGRPLTILPATEHQVVIVNYLLDSLQVADLRKDSIARTIPLGGPAQAAPARKGEALFYDARRSHNQWFSCHTCHVDGHTCCLTFDTLNDDSYGTPKLTPSLHNVTHTGPWTWHGWQKDLSAAVTKSLTQTMFGPAPTKGDVKALVAYLDTLTPPPHPSNASQGAAVQRGREIFHGKAACSRCHRPPYYTSPGLYDVKLEPDGSPYELWNPPSLIGLYDRGPYLHDGRAKSLADLLQAHHTSEMVGGRVLSEAERADLIAFLLSL